MIPKNSQIPRFTLKADGAVYGAYLTYDDAEEVKGRLDKKGFSNVTIIDGAKEWLYPEEEEAPKKKKK